MEVETFERLLAPEGRVLLAEVARRAGVESDLGLGTRLRRMYDPALVAAAVTQNHLRGRAAAKLGEDAATMWFTHDGLEQATRARVAAARAERLAAAGVRTVVDLGCGIGADLVALARAGLQVHGVDLDPVRVAVARANLAALDLPGTVEVADAEQVDVGAYDAAFVDPARRDGRGRTFDPRAARPGWDVVTGLLLDGPAHGVAKVAPGIAHDLVPEGVEAQWVGDGGDLVEACLWGRAFAGVRRRATVLPAGASVSDLDLPGSPLLGGGVGAYLHEPDDVVGRAGLVQAVAAQVGGWVLDPHLAYVAADEHVPSTFTRAYRVLEELPFREKQLKAALRERDVGTLTVKRRGVDVVPEVLVRRFGLRGSVRATVVLTRVDGEGTALLVEPLPR